VPEIAARAHVERLDSLIRLAMDEAGVGWVGLTGIAATAGPGLIGGVMAGLSTAKAIALAVSTAREGDIILIAGKGHEDYQIIGTEKRNFDDRREAEAALRMRMAK
jgi:hypothetical protein